MNALNRIITGTCAEFLVAMLAGAPAVADDTDLLLVPPPPSDETEPRIMFIIDTSTSMNSVEDTPIPYNQAQAYSGECNSDAIYYMLITGVEPHCAGTNEGYIDKDNWNCEAAETQMNGLGSFNGVLAQYRDGGIVYGSDFVYLIFGLRRGGFEYYALDVTNKSSPKLLWNVTYPDMGESWSTPVVTPIDINTAGMTRSIPSQVRVIDMSGDGFADRMYAADLGGQLLRFNIKNGEAPANLVAGGVIAQLGAEGQAVQDFATTRRFYTTPEVSLFSDRTKNKRFISLSIGSGYRAHPLDESAADSCFSVRDPDVFNQLTQADYNSYDVVTDADLVEVSGSVRTIFDPARRGWKFTLPANQKVLSDSVTFDDTVTFVGFSPEANNSDGCAPSLGKNFLYRVSVENGDPVVNNLDTLDPADADDKRIEELAQGGIAPTPTILFPSPDDPKCTGTDCAVPPIGCVGVECFDPGFANIPVRTLWTQNGIV